MPEELRGQAKRRARTRAALLAAGRGLLVDGREHASIEEITKRAGVGFGSFFNHFPDGKEEFFQEAVLEVLDLYAAGLTAVNADLDDPAEIFARSFRLTGRTAMFEPSLLAPLLARGTEVLLIRRGLREAALADLRAGVGSGRFAALDPEVHLMAVGGVLLGLVRLVTADPDKVSEETIDDVAMGALRLLGVPAAEAEAIVCLPLPDVSPLLGPADAGSLASEI